MFPELGGVVGFVLDIQQLLQPLRAQALLRTVLRFVDFVEPVRRHAGLGDQVHGLGAHLKFHINASRADQGRCRFPNSVRLLWELSRERSR